MQISSTSQVFDTSLLTVFTQTCFSVVSGVILLRIFGCVCPCADQSLLHEDAERVHTVPHQLITWIAKTSHHDKSIPKFITTTPASHFLKCRDSRLRIFQYPEALLQILTPCAPYASANPDPSLPLPLPPHIPSPLHFAPLSSLFPLSLSPRSPRNATPPLSRPSPRFVPSLSPLCSPTRPVSSPPSFSRPRSRLLAHVSALFLLPAPRSPPLAPLACSPHTHTLPPSPPPPPPPCFPLFAFFRSPLPLALFPSSPP
jgi:hypothetical protein